MDELFLYLYLGDITENVRIICAIGVIIFAGIVLFDVVVNEEHSISEELETKLAKLSKLSKWLVIFFLLLGVLTPSKFFFYTLAGTKAGEITISSELGKKAIEALNIQLDEYIRGIKDKETK